VSALRRDRDRRTAAAPRAGLPLSWLEMHSTASRGALVGMVEATENRHRPYQPRRIRAPRWQRLRGRLLEPLVRTRLVEVGHVLPEHAGEVALAEDQDVIQALAPYAPQEALAHRIRPWRTIGRSHDRDATRRRHPREGRPESAVVVVDEIPRALVERGRLAELLRDPGVRRVPRHAHMDDAPGRQGDDEEGEQGSEGQIRDWQEVARPDVTGVVAQERRPGLPPRARGNGTAQVGLDGPLRHPDTELQELAAYPFGTPERILGRQPPDQGDGLRRERRAARPRARLPSPERAEARVVPAQQRLRLDDEEGLPPGAGPAGEQHQERAIRRRRGRALDPTAQHDQLVAQEGVLGEQLRPATQQVGTSARRVRPHRRPRPEAGAQGVPHSGNNSGEPPTAPTHDHHQVVAPYSAHRPRRSPDPPSARDSSRPTGLATSSILARSNPG